MKCRRIGTMYHRRSIHLSVQLRFDLGQFDYLLHSDTVDKFEFFASTTVYFQSKIIIFYRLYCKKNILFIN